MGYVLYAGLAGRSDRRAAIAAAVVAGESLVFVGNRCRCPLTQVAEQLGAERGSVTDIYLPDWLARNLPAIHVPLIVLAIVLHARNILRHRPVLAGLRRDLANLQHLLACHPGAAGSGGGVDRGGRVRWRACSSRSRSRRDLLLTCIRF